MTVEVGAEFILDLSGRVNKLHKLMKNSTNPVRKPIGNSLVIPTGFSGSGPVNLQMNPQCPARGRIWNVLRVAIFGPDTHTLVANVNADFYAGTLVDPNPPSLDDIVLNNQVVPSLTNLNRLSTWCSSGESVFVQLYGTGLAAGQQYIGIGYVAEYDVSDVEEMRIG